MGNPFSEGREGGARGYTSKKLHSWDLLLVQEQEFKPQTTRSIDSLVSHIILNIMLGFWLSSKECIFYFQPLSLIAEGPMEQNLQ